VSLHPATARAIRATYRRTRSLLATAAAVSVEPSTVRRVVGSLATRRHITPMTDAMRASIVERRRCGVPVAVIADSLGVGAERVRDVLAETGVTGRVKPPACVLCGRTSWVLVAYEDADADAGDRVCATGAGCSL
jgi:hypothetical protein